MKLDHKKGQEWNLEGRLRSAAKLCLGEKTLVSEWWESRGNRRVMFGILLVDWVGNRLPRESKEPSVSPRFED